MPPRSLVSIVVCPSLAAVVRCGPAGVGGPPPVQEPPASASFALASSGSSPVRAASPALPAPASAPCQAASDGVEVDRAALGLAVTDVVDVAIAATGDRALVSFAVDGNLGCVEDGCFVEHQVFQFAIGAAPPRVSAPPTSAVGISPSESAAPLVVDGDLLLLTQGHAGAVPMPVPGQPWRGPADTLFLVRGSDVVLRSEKWFSGAFAAKGAGSRALVVGAGREAGWQRDPAAPASVRIFVVSAQGIGPGERVRVAGDPAKGNDVSFDAPAVVIDSERAAIAYREGRGMHAVPPGPADDGPRRIWVGWVDPHTGQVTRGPVMIGSGDAGKPALLLDQDVLHVVWAQRPSAAVPYQLRQVTWRAGDAAPGAEMALSASSRSALAPSLARVGSETAVAWMDSDGPRHGAVHAGIADSLEHAAATARRISPDDAVNARDPHWGEAGARAFLVWTEHHAGGARIRWTRCGAP